MQAKRRAFKQWIEWVVLRGWHPSDTIKWKENIQFEKRKKKQKTDTKNSKWKEKKQTRSKLPFVKKSHLFNVRQEAAVKITVSVRGI